MGATLADYDEDGDLDIYVTAFGPNRLWRNDGDAGFVDVIASNVFTDDQPPGDNQWLVIRARRP